MKNIMFYHLIIFVSFVNDCENHWCSWSYCSFTFVFPKGNSSLLHLAGRSGSAPPPVLVRTKHAWCGKYPPLPPPPHPPTDPLLPARQSTYHSQEESRWPEMLFCNMAAVGFVLSCLCHSSQVCCLA